MELKINQNKYGHISAIWHEICMASEIVDFILTTSKLCQSFSLRDFRACRGHGAAIPRNFDVKRTLLNSKIHRAIVTGANLHIPILPLIIRSRSTQRRLRPGRRKAAAPSPHLAQSQSDPVGRAVLKMFGPSALGMQWDVVMFHAALRGKGGSGD
jgi:hypothetical protein